MRNILPRDFTFADWLALELRKRGLGVRTLARKIDPDRIDTVRSQLQKYMRAQIWPEDAMRQKIADALGIPVVEVPRRETNEQH